MRKTILTIASVAALALPFFALVPSSTAGATTPATPTCKTSTGTATFAPALPPVTKPNPKVLSTITGNGNVKSCTGGGVTSATMSAKIKFKTPGNCTTLAEGTGGAITGTVTFKWNTGKTSTHRGRQAHAGQGRRNEATISGKITAGLFVGKTASQTITVHVEVRQLHVDPALRGQLHAEDEDDAHHQVAEPVQRPSVARSRTGNRAASSRLASYGALTLTASTRASNSWRTPTGLVM